MITLNMHVVSLILGLISLTENLGFFFFPGGIHSQLIAPEDDRGCGRKTLKEVTQDLQAGLAADVFPQFPPVLKETVELAVEIFPSLGSTFLVTSVDIDCLVLVTNVDIDCLVLVTSADIDRGDIQVCLFLAIAKGDERVCLWQRLLSLLESIVGKKKRKQIIEAQRLTLSVLC